MKIFISNGYNLSTQFQETQFYISHRKIALDSHKRVFQLKTLNNIFYHDKKTIFVWKM